MRFLLTLLAAPAFAGLDWDAAAINKWQAKKAKATVPVRVWVVPGAKIDGARFATQLMGANKAFNNASGGSASCGIRFKFAAVMPLELPDKWTELADFTRDEVGKRAENFYANPERLSRAEVALFEKLGRPKPGELQVVYFPSLGSRRGYAYTKLPVRRMAKKDLPFGRSPEQVFERYRGVILLADTTNLFALAHEAAHSLSGLGHSSTCDLAQIEKDHEGCLAMRRNILLEEGFGDHATEAQCRAFLRGVLSPPSR